MKKILIDENLPSRLVALFVGTSISAVSVFDLGLGGEADGIIFQYAIDNDCVLLSKDSDFIDLAVFRGAGQVIILQTGNISNKDLPAFIIQRMATIEEFVQTQTGILLLD